MSSRQQWILIGVIFFLATIVGLAGLVSKSSNQSESAPLVQSETKLPVHSVHHFVTPEGLECVSTNSPNEKDYRRGISCNWEIYNYKKNNNLL